MKNNFLTVFYGLFLFTNSFAGSTQSFIEIPELIQTKVLKIILLDKNYIQISKTNTGRYFEFCNTQNECSPLASSQLDILSKKIQLSNSKEVFNLATSEAALKNISYSENKFITDSNSTKVLSLVGGAIGLALSNSLNQLPYKSLSKEDYKAIKNTFLSVNVLDKTSGEIEFPVSSAYYLQQMTQAFTALKNLN